MTTQQYLMILGAIYVAHVNDKTLNAILGFALIGTSIGMLLGWI